MLTARDSRNDSLVALPDYEESDELAALRSLASAGTLVCPACRESLWLRAGEQRRPHFAHRVLADCRHGVVSVAILESRRLLYLFFQERIEAGKLSGPVELEPVLPALPEDVAVDLILRREGKPPVAVVLLESGMKPEPRWALRSAIASQGFIPRVVFLSATLKDKQDASNVFLLSTTQRELTHKSPFGLAEDDWGARDSLHFVDHERERWISLRCLRLEHPPQVYEAGSVQKNLMKDLLWSDGCAEWTHPGESRSRRTAPPPAPMPNSSPPLRQRRKIGTTPFQPPPKPPYEPPAWMTAGLVCIGCQVRTIDWQTATPGEDRCICKSCFQKGVR